MEQQNIFQRVKQLVTTRQAASFYGLKVGRNGMCRCPFHDDRTPSMKVDERFHCFGCRADGDVINFVSKLFGLSSHDAALKLAADFGIETGQAERYHPRQMKPPSHYRSEDDRIEKALLSFYRIFTDYYHTLHDWQERYAPRSPADAWDERFLKAVQRLTTIEYALDCFLEGDRQEQISIMNDYREEVQAYERDKSDREHSAESGCICA